jgi:Transposase
MPYPTGSNGAFPEHLGLQADQVNFFNDDRVGRALDHLRRADRATLLTALILHVVHEFQIDLREFHQDTTTVTVHGDYAGQPPIEQANRPPRITFGYNKDHRPDLKQLVYSCHDQFGWRGARSLQDL